MAPLKQSDLKIKESIIEFCILKKAMVTSIMKTQKKQKQKEIDHDIVIRMFENLKDWMLKKCL